MRVWMVLSMICLKWLDRFLRGVVWKCGMGRGSVKGKMKEVMRLMRGGMGRVKNGEI